MTTRKAQKKDSAKLRGSLLIVTFSTILVGCVVTPEDNETEEENPKNAEGGNSEDQQDEQEFIATSYTTSTQLGVNLEIRVRPLELLEEDTLKLSMEVTNSSDKSYSLRDALSDTDNMHSASNATLIDSVHQNRYFSNKLADGSCFCTFADGQLASDESIDLEVMFPAPPGDIESMTVATPVTSPFFDVPITQSSEPVNEEYSEGDILPLTMISDNEGEEGWSEQESEEERSILLSSDVLFDFDSAALTSDADKIIEQVAREIDQSSSDTVTIDGYTDNEGSDSVNLPLSEERAESVESEISELVTRDGITFDIEGHGASNPVADNETEEGRELNRRVTVTFEN